MADAIDIQVIDNTTCAFDGTAIIPESGAVLIAEAKGKDSINGNWTGIRVNLTDIDTGAFRSFAAQSDSEQVDLPVVVREGGRYRIQAVQTNFRETCDWTIVRGRVLEPNFFG